MSVLLVGAGGYSALLDFLTVADGYKKSAVLETRAVPKGYRAFWSASTAPPSVVLISLLQK